MPHSVIAATVQCAAEGDERGVGSGAGGAAHRGVRRRGAQHLLPLPHPRLRRHWPHGLLRSSSYALMRSSCMLSSSPPLFLCSIQRASVCVSVSLLCTTSPCRVAE
eukprot:130445-Rhodomonas_salina.1